MTRPNLGDIEQRASAATDGPWRPWEGDGDRRGAAAVETAWSHGPDDEDTDLITDWCAPEDAEFIAASRADIPALTGAIRAVLELHKPVPMVPGIEEAPVCDGCENPGRFVRWPCATVQAITEHIDT